MGGVWNSLNIYYLIAEETEIDQRDDFESMPIPSAHSFHKYLLEAFYVLCVVWLLEYSSELKRALGLIEFIFQWEERDNEPEINVHYAR